MTRPDQHHRAVVIDLREPEAAVLLRDLHAQGANRLESVDHLVGDPPLGLDCLRIDLVLQKRAEDPQETLAFLYSVERQIRLGGDQVRLEVAQVEPLTKAGQLPVLLPSRLRDRSSFFVAGVSRHGCTSVIGVAAVGIRRRSPVKHEAQGNEMRSAFDYKTPTTHPTLGGMEISARTAFNCQTIPG